jgi:hypothetical protein
LYTCPTNCQFFHPTLAGFPLLQDVRLHSFLCLTQRLQKIGSPLPALLSLRITQLSRDPHPALGALYINSLLSPLSASFDSQPRYHNYTELPLDTYLSLFSRDLIPTFSPYIPIPLFRRVPSKPEILMSVDLRQAFTSLRFPKRIATVSRSQLSISHTGDSTIYPN